MSKTINVRVRDKIATADAAAYYVCGNSDYIIAFDFDAEWDEFEVKTARFVYNGEHVDVVFTGDSVEVPIIEDTYNFTVGVYAGNMHTTTPAYVPAKKSILCGGGTPKPPAEDVYAQITELCNEAVSEAKSVRYDADAGKFNGAPGKTPIAGKDYFTEADKQAIAAEAADAVGFPQPTASENGKFLCCADGKAAWLPMELSGGGDKWELIHHGTVGEDGVDSYLVDADMDGNPFSLTKFELTWTVYNQNGYPALSYGGPTFNGLSKGYFSTNGNKSTNDSYLGAVGNDSTIDKTKGIHTIARYYGEVIDGYLMIRGLMSGYGYNADGNVVLLSGVAGNFYVSKWNDSISKGQLFNDGVKSFEIHYLYRSLHNAVVTIRGVRA